MTDTIHNTDARSGDYIVIRAEDALTGDQLIERAIALCQAEGLLATDRNILRFISEWKPGRPICV